MKSDNNAPVITIDGPSGTGKGTICHMLAAHLHWHVLDSGAIYRVLAFALRKQNVAVNDTQNIVRLANSLDVQFVMDPDKKNGVILDGINVIRELRSEQCGQDASVIAAIPEVRLALLERQRAFALPPGLVTDGRDMGTVVFPNAIIKVYLYASTEERAHRRYAQLKEIGISISLPQVIEELEKRDARDTHRDFAPLRPAEDAVMVDTTGLSIVQVFNYVLKLTMEHPYFR